MRWSLVRHITGQYVKVCYTDEQSNDKEHASLQPSKLKQDAEPLGLLKNTNRYPCFNSNPKLSNKLGQEKLKTFVKSTLSLDKSNNSFYSPIKRTPLTTFADMKKKTTEASKSGNNVAVLDPDFAFLRTLVL